MCQDISLAFSGLKIAVSSEQHRDRMKAGIRFALFFSVVHCIKRNSQKTLKKVPFVVDPSLSFTFYLQKLQHLVWVQITHLCGVQQTAFPTLVFAPATTIYRLTLVGKPINMPFTLVPSSFIACNIFCVAQIRKCIVQ